MICLGGMESVVPTEPPAVCCRGSSTLQASTSRFHRVKGTEHKACVLLLVLLASSCEYFPPVITVRSKLCDLKLYDSSSMIQRKDRITKEEALSFLLTHIVVERNIELKLDQLGLFNLTTLAQQAVDKMGETEGMIPHEVLEQLAADFLDDQ